MVMASLLGPVHLAVGGPIQTIVHILCGAVALGMVLGDKNRVMWERFRPLAVAMLGHQVWKVQRLARVELEMHDVKLVARDLLKQRAATVDFDHPCKWAVGAGTRQKSDLMPQGDQPPGQILDHTFSAAVGINGNAKGQGEQDFHG